jgi:hypothetical protein
MKKIINKIVLISILFLGLVSCENNGYEDFKQETTPSVAMNGEWYINITDEASGEVQVEHALHKTFDSNDGKMHITDRILASDPAKFTGWWLETKLDVNTKDLTFSITDALNTADESKVKITEGKIIKNAAKSKTGVVVDSIYFKAVFDYEPTQVLIYSGHRRTGFLEDDF